jgi:hypothetical protein
MINKELLIKHRHSLVHFLAQKRTFKIAFCVQQDVSRYTFVSFGISEKRRHGN